MAPTASTLLRLANGPDDGVYLYYDHSENGILDLLFTVVDSETGRMEVVFRAPGTLFPGTYSDVITLEFCLDEPCRFPVVGSPMTFEVTYTVTELVAELPPPDPEPEPAWPVLEPLQRITLTHDVVAAQYSAALDAIVMVASRPSPSLHVYLLASGQRQEQALLRVPTSLGLSTDGRFAAVGHDAMVTHVDLASLASEDPAVILLDVSALVGALVLDRHGVVHAIPQEGQWVSLHSVDAATNEERLSVNGFLRSGGVAALHPTEDAFYVATRGIFPEKIEKHFIADGVAAERRDSPYHGDHQACGNVWLSGSGDSIYTACGNTFRSSPLASQDMHYTGRIELSFERGRIESLSHTSAGTDVLFIESNRFSTSCPFHGASAGCLTRVTVVGSEMLDLRERYDLPAISSGNDSLSQRALFVFQGLDGHGRYLITRLVDVPAETHYLNILR